MLRSPKCDAMLFRLVRPMKRKGSRHHQFAKRIPSDIAPRMVGMRLDVPLGEATVQVMVGKNATIRLSLRTDRPNEVNQ